MAKRLVAGQFKCIRAGARKQFPTTRDVLFYYDASPHFLVHIFPFFEQSTFSEVTLEY
jgi:hypothetical protein